MYTNTEQVQAAMQRLHVDMAQVLDSEEAAAQTFYDSVMIATSQVVIQHGNDSYIMNTL